MTRDPIAYVARKPSSRWITALSEAMPGERVMPLDRLSPSERSGVRLAIVADPDPADLAVLPNLEWVHSTWAGVERLVAELPSTLPIVRLTDPQLADTMAEAVLTAVLWLHRHGHTYAQQQRRRVWAMQDVPIPAARRISILGLGRLGRQAAERLVANGFAVSGWSRSAKLVDGITTFHGAAGFHSALDADIVVSLLPATPETKGIIDAAAFGAMPRGAAFVNFGRGATVDETALLAALDNGHLDHALLDVFATEPLPPNHPFWAHERVTVWPHASAPTNKQTASVVIAEAVGQWRQTGALPPAVDRARGY